MISTQHEPVTNPSPRAKFADQFEQNYRLTVRFLISRGIRHDTAEEFAQAAWARGWERLEQLKNPEMMLSWVNSIALNMFRGAARCHGEVVPLDRDLRASVQSDMHRLDASKLMKLCNEDDQSLLRRYYFDGVEASELAAEAGVSTITIRVRLSRARHGIATRVAARAASN